MSRAAFIPERGPMSRWRCHEKIFEEGDKPGGVYLLASGLVKAVKYSPRERPYTMEIIVPGHFFGLIAALDRKPYPVSAVAIQASEAYHIQQSVFDQRLQTDPAFARLVYAQVGAHLRHGQELRSLQKESVEKRIAYVLHLLGKNLGTTLPIGRDEIADMAGANVETVIRTLAGFRRNRLVATGWKRVTLLNPGGLLRLAGPL